VTRASWRALGLLAAMPLAGASCTTKEAPAPSPAPVATAASADVLDAAETKVDAAHPAGEADAAEPTDASSDAEAAAAALPRVHRVLEVGDSMVGYASGLAKVMKLRLGPAGVEFHSDAVTSASIATFDDSGKLEKLVKMFDPELVIVNLGTNTLSVPHPESLADHARHIAAKIAPRRCLWLGPPSLHQTPPKTPSPLIAVLREAVAPCTFFDASELVLERQPDGIHPTERGAMVWADAFAPVLAPLLGGGATPGDAGVYTFGAPTTPAP
jgi:hypothetical protein